MLSCDKRGHYKENVIINEQLSPFEMYYFYKFYVSNNKLSDVQILNTFLPHQLID